MGKARITVTVEYTPYGGISFDDRIEELARETATELAANLIKYHRIIEISDISSKHERLHGS